MSTGLINAAVALLVLPAALDCAAACECRCAPCGEENPLDFRKRLVVVHVPDRRDTTIKPPRILI